VQIGRNTPTGCGRRSVSVSCQAVQTLSMKEPRGSPEFESGHSGRDRPRWVSVMRFEDAAVNGRNAQIAVIARRPTERVEPTRADTRHLRRMLSRHRTSDTERRNESQRVQTQPQCDRRIRRSASYRLRSGDRASLTGSVMTAGQPIAGATVTLYAAATGTPTQLARGKPTTPVPSR
jgi:hypothetical protein